MKTITSYGTVHTKYLAPTNNRNARVKAVSITGKSVTLSWDHSLGVDENHIKAAEKLGYELGYSITGKCVSPVGPGGYLWLLGSGVEVEVDEP